MNPVTSLSDLRKNVFPTGKSPETFRSEIRFYDDSSDTMRGTVIRPGCKNWLWPLTQKVSIWWPNDTQTIISRITSRAAELHITMGRSNKKRKILLCIGICSASSFKQMNHFIQIEDLNALLCVMTENMTRDIQSFIQKLQAFGCCCIQMDPDIDGTNPRSSYCARITVNQDFGVEFVSYALNLDGVSPSS